MTAYACFIAGVVVALLVGAATYAGCRWSDRKLDQAFKRADRLRDVEDRFPPGPPPWHRGR